MAAPVAAMSLLYHVRAAFDVSQLTAEQVATVVSVVGIGIVLIMLYNIAKNTREPWL